MNQRESDLHQTRLERPYATPEDQAKAYAYLQRRHAAGMLAPIADWPGDLVAGYADILGVKP